MNPLWCESSLRHLVCWPRARGDTRDERGARGQCLRSIAKRVRLPSPDSILDDIVRRGPGLSRRTGRCSVSTSTANSGLVVLVDGYGLIFRAYHALPPTLATAQGEQTNAVFGFASMLLDVIRQRK